MADLTHLKWVFDIRKDILWRKHQVMYLYPAPGLDLKRIQDILKKGLDAKFQAVAGRYLKAFMTEGKEPPAAIASTIRNFADDVALGRDITIRGGDYIAIQGFIQRGEK